MTVPKRVCKECGKSKPETRFWHHKDGSGFEICKNCACKYIDNKKPSTFLWILKEADVPFIEERWIELCRKKYSKDPARFGSNSVIGTYLRTMYMRNFIDYSYSDTLELNKRVIDERKQEAENRERAKEKAKEFEKEVKAISFSGDLLDSAIPDPPSSEEKYEIDSIFQEEIEEPKRPVLSSGDYNKIPATAYKGKRGELESNNISTYDIIDVDEQAILNDLTPNDVQYLAMKWGSSFKPSEWVKMEEMYQKYCNEFDISVDREAVLISMCKTSINMQRCLDSGDAANASKFSTMFDQLRKSGAFTEAQKKEEKSHYLDSIGELVGTVEREGGVIPKFDYEFEVNPDKVDLTLKDMKSYTYNLVKNEMGLGDLIESYIQKLEQQMEEEKNKSLSDGLITSKADEQQVQNDEYADDWLNNLENSIAANADELYAKIGDDEDDKYIEMIRANQQKEGEE